MGDLPFEATEVERLSVEAILAQLEDAQEEPPLEAIRAARQRRDEIVPRLIDILREATAKARIGEFRDGDAHWVSLYLFAEFRATEALPAVLEAVSLPGELPFDLFGDLLTEDLARVLLSLGSDVATLDAMIGNDGLNLYVRWQAADAITALVLDGDLPRAEGVELLRRHLRAELDGKCDASVLAALIMDLSSIWPVEAQADIREAFDRDLVDPWDIKWREVEEDLAAGQEGMRERAVNQKPSRITDAIAELETWHFPAKDDFHWSDGPAEDDEDFVAADPSYEDDPVYGEGPPPLRAEARVGRNEACPCGSGKKYKKCCGRPGA